MSSRDIRVESGGIFSSAQNLEKEPSKFKPFGFAVLIILGIGGLIVAGIGTGGLLHSGALTNLGQVNSIIMVVISGGVGIPFLVIGIVGFINTLSGSAESAKKTAIQDAKHSILEESEHTKHEHEKIKKPHEERRVRERDGMMQQEELDATSIQFEWHQLDLQEKNDLVNEIIRNPRSGTKTITIRGAKTIDINYEFKDSGTSANVYLVSVGEDKFALKILHSDKLGDSAQKLQGHSINGIVPIRAAEIVKVDDGPRAIIVMDNLEDNWNNWFNKPNNSKASNLGFGLNCIKQVIEALINLENAGFVHGNIAEPNIMFDKDRIFIVDIDLLPPITDEYASYKRRGDMGNIKNLLGSVARNCGLNHKHPLSKYCLSAVPNTLEEFLEEINAQINNFKAM